MLFSEPKKNEKSDLKKILILAVVFSFLFGGLAGTAGSILMMQNIDKFGFVFQNADGLKIEKIETEKISLIEEDSATINVVKKASPAVVSIIISKEVDLSGAYMPFGNLGPFGFRFEDSQSPEKTKQKREIGGGTGFIISDDGLILTNKHVVADSAAEYTVITNDGSKYEAQVLGRDPINDLAVIKIEASGLAPLILGDSDRLQIGQTVIAIGNALSEFRNTVTRGVISGIGRRVEARSGLGYTEVIEEAIQTDAAINPGNSGGPLLNLKGEAIGINTAISQSGQLVGFAIPINEAKQVIDSIKKYGKIVRPFLGVRYVIINKSLAEANDLPVDYGALISQNSNDGISAIVPDSPAEKAGLEVNDIILEVNGQRIDENHSLGRVLSKSDPGDEVEIKILRKGEEKKVKVILIERPNE